jgi:response regulator of citrate/malate metabolism
MSVGWQVLIVDADANAVAMHRAAVAATSCLQVAAVVPSVADAIPWLAGRHCDLLLLELQLPEQDGLALLRCLREHDNPIEVIAATSTSESRAVRACAHCGVVDYLVKPFSRMRLQQALDAFVVRVSALAGADLHQAEIDRVRAPRSSSFWRSTE